jgi:uncharacterized protein
MTTSDTPTITAHNKRLVQEIFAEMANGNSRPLVENMADGFRWTMAGTGPWARTWDGKQAVLTQLFPALRAILEPPIRTIAHRFVADGDHVVVEARGDNTTRTGAPYRNTYCFVFRLADGKLQEVTEYMDTALVAALLPDP